ncbi:hypothetical protein GCM10010425_37790 [Streptomyces spororaveus]|uniref:Uncharacterized protein n=1 Tax=Streptomyces spororaveus TaxID=284039 RepID=A0ABQ3TPG9_9ACTN|nr:hypothetical protein Sspor_78710 [Streptomyces spororaveus]
MCAGAVETGVRDGCQADTSRAEDPDRIHLGHVAFGDALVDAADGDGVGVGRSRRLRLSRPWKASVFTTLPSSLAYVKEVAPPGWTGLDRPRMGRSVPCVGLSAPCRPLHTVQW